MVPSLVWVTLWLISRTLLVRTATPPDVNSTAPIVDLGYAQYQGYFEAQTNITQFLGIRYAAPPLGRLRFHAPQPPILESGVQLAAQNPDMCYQAPLGGNAIAPVSPHQYNVSEDCLFLNVFVPGSIPAGPVTTGGLPVLVWIHGGGYVFGYAAQYNGADLVADSLNSVVVVVIQYRLGAFGFLPGNEIEAQGALNAGLLDQNFALQWVQKHIGQFGGDKNRVTIWGESAGAGSVLQHVIANGGNTQPPLFNAAMVSSTYLPSQYHYNDQLPQSLYSKVVAMTGCASSIDTFNCLQSVDTETLQAASYELAVSAFFGTSAFVPVVDGTFILERPTVTLAKGKVNGQVLLAVSNQNEGNELIDPNEKYEIADYVSQLFPHMTPSQLTEAARVYQDYGTTLEQASKVMGDAILVCPTYYLLRAFAGRAWKGLFAIPPAYHAQDAIYYFHSPDAPPPYDDPQFVTAFSESFMSLVKYDDVNVKFDPENITPHWDLYVRECERGCGEDWAGTEMLFNRTEAGAPAIVPIQTDPALHLRCAFWSSVTSETVQ